MRQVNPMWKNDLLMRIANLPGTDIALCIELPPLGLYFLPRPHVTPSQSSNCVCITRRPLEHPWKGQEATHSKFCRMHLYMVLKLRGI